MLTPLLFADSMGGEISNLVWETGPVAKVVLAILLLFSIFSWAIIVQKYGLLNKARAQSARFMRAFRKANRLQDIAAVSEQFKPSPLVSVFEGGYDESCRSRAGCANPPTVQRAMQISASEELTRLERRLPWLATCGSVTPLLGCSARSGASSTRSMVSAPPARPPCARLRPEFPKR